jgi:hemoglobin
MSTTQTEAGAGAESSPYELLGGEAGVRALVDRFYDLMDADPAYHAVRRVHGGDLTRARDRLFWFLSGWLGGPPLYMQRVGHPMLRARHLPFPIGTAERDAWMGCFAHAMADRGVPEFLREPLRAALFKTADWMRNRPD